MAIKLFNTAPMDENTVREIRYTFIHVNFHLTLLEQELDLQI